jgi:GT2 family glycosyltransferase
LARKLATSIGQATKVIPVLGFATLTRFDLADRLLASIDYPVEHLVIIDNSGTQSWNPSKPEKVNNLWLIRVPYGLGLVGAWNLIIKSTPYASYWVLVNDDAWFAMGALEIIAMDADPEGLSFPHVVPDWSCIVIGQKVVETVGLYDERFYPLYFDDNDYERRIRNADLPVKRIDAIVHHQNNSTLKGNEQKNAVSFQNNQKLMTAKVSNNDFTEGNWSLKIRRENSWG